MRRYINSFMHALRGSKGSTIITVLVAWALVSILGVILLYVTYTGYTMKVTERGGVRNFYNAEAAVNEIRVGIQKAVSDAIASANTTVLEHYNAVTADDSTDDFKDEFVKSLFKWKITEGVDSFKLLHEQICPGSNPLGDYYDAETLKTRFITPSEQGYVELTTGVEGYDGKYGNVVRATGDSTITLKNITLKYTRDGFETNITTDIVITVPNFTYAVTDLVTTAIQDYVIVADTALEQSSGMGLTLKGNVYAGQVNLSGAGSSLTIGLNTGESYQFINNGAFSINNAFSLNVCTETSLWTESIKLGPGASAAFTGETYVADDLELNGNSSEAVLSGRYFGFGADTVDAKKSSAIVINGRNTILQLRPALTTLMLAGNSFIGITDAPGNPDDIITGESVSVKSNQIAYLIPPDCLNTVDTNPCIYPNLAAVPDAATLQTYVNKDTPLWAGGGTLTDYHAGVKLAILHITGSDQMLVYFYLQFDSAADASRYFKSYFQNNSDKIEKYMKLYSGTLSMANTINGMVSGNTVYYNTAGDVALKDPSTSGFVSAAALLNTRYQNLRKTLSPNNAGDATETVYTNVVNVDAVAGLPNYNTCFTDLDGNTVGLITKSTPVRVSEILTAYPHIKVIVAQGNGVSKGDVIVDSPFEGLILANGTVKLQNNVSLDRSGVSLALKATYNTGTEEKTLMSYLNIGSGSEAAVDSNTVTWDLKTLVGYSRWTKY